MSLEVAIQELSKRVDTLIEVITKDGALRAEIKDKIEAISTEKAPKPAASEKKAETKPADEKPATEARQISDSPEDRKEADPDPAPEDIEIAKKKVVAFFDAAADDEDRKKRRADVEGLLAKLNAQKISQLAAGDAQRLSNAIDKLTERYAAKPAGDDLL